MKISYINCTNIKSFKTLSLNLIDFNVIIGLNGSGKSNFILVFKFIKDILNYSLKKAIEIQGGANNMRNYYLKNDNSSIKLNFVLELLSELNSTLNIKNTTYQLRITKIDSDFEFNITENNYFKVIKDSLKIKIEYFDDKVKVATSEIELHRKDNKYEFQIHNFDSLDYSLSELFPILESIKDKIYADDEIILHNIFRDLFNIEISKSAAKQISIYEFEQDLLSKIRSSNIEDEEETSEHFTKLLFSVLNDEEKRRKFFNLMNYVLPDYEDVKVNLNTEQNHKIMVKEKYYNSYIPVELLSNGTIFLMIIILSLYFDEKYLTIFDEPERTIHPNVISKVVDMMKDVSNLKQIILSTHNSEIVKYSDIKNILIISRDPQGFSQISQPINSKAISTFLENDIGLDELFVQNML